MTSEDWDRITDDLNAILEHAGSEAAVLAGEPPEIRAEVSRLLEAHRAADRESTAADQHRSHDEV
jgi:hypothetical protein